MQPAKYLKIVTAIVAFAPVLGAQTKPPREPIARIGDQAIYDDDLLPSIGGQLWQLRSQEYELKIKALENLLNQRLLENEAKSQGLSTDALLEQTVDRNLPPLSASEIEAYYLAQKSSLNRPFDEVRPQVERSLAQARRQQARQEYIDRLRQRSDVAILLNRPKVEVTVDLTRVRGSPDAPVTIVEFADFQCPYCQSVQSTLKAVMEKYKGKVRLGFRDFPLRPIHPQAQQAAEAARCAAEQGKFWEYHDLLYTNQVRLDSGSLREHARGLGLDVEAFEACTASGKFKSQIDNDLQSGSIAGVSGTPAFYINGFMLVGAQPVAAFESMIESALAENASRKPAP